MRLYYYGVRFFKYTEGTDSTEMSGRVYSYQSTFKCRVGDLVVVECRDGHKIVKIVESGLQFKEKASAFIICNVTTESAKVNEAKNKIFRMEALRRAMETKLTESKFIEMCQTMAAQDPDLQALLDEYKVLTANVTDE